MEETTQLSITVNVFASDGIAQTGQMGHDFGIVLRYGSAKQRHTVGGVVRQVLHWGPPHRADIVTELEDVPCMLWTVM